MLLWLLLHWGTLRLLTSLQVLLMFSLSDSSVKYDMH